ncbi:MAG: hypothetical protein A3I44_02290 [Candidatus Sungbacteria bacterium RIFCSPLOWO2_02_FULL_51_17]|uniref:Uncharacterized protein n=1 Tax=Candidatus Sungbacteria bacterium RIFCSPHIGHO2_02_FULL_51_29 TaxID=1802273 RepID=A0A1G2L097_9BACT|nr:MAG: hypothetical protein A2676_01965 [Candidatus Sungbacteria bacterium RIFCSPHIGHO2_01_FULL_51_22]OHA04109.1 MAG: hypothetical protein A3C16_02165 [Candidatus Sungbacteria bacterium RIFCSPHIGHO2_02_FULL_51_29]OHA12023.1 MAG: hypothetical protein A3I44_02290 [Candidatus Sungbacteria bacterium RIFCSPLOWO2_02_FULL_51_17]
MRALVKRGSSAFMRQRSDEGDIMFHRDGTLQKTLAAQMRYQQEFIELNDQLEEQLDIHPDRRRGFMARILSSILPERVQAWLPESTLRILRERSDIIELLEEKQRMNLNNQGKAIENIANVAVEGRQLLVELEVDIRQAEDERWDARRLHDYLCEMAQQIANPLGTAGLGIEVPEILSEILDHEFAMFSPEEMEEERQALLKLLRETIELQRGYMKMLGTQVAANSQAYRAALTQYFSYTTVGRPTQALRESARIMTETNKAMYVAREAIIATVRRSIEATCIMLEAIQRVPDYAIASPEMQAFIAEQNTKLQNKLAELKRAKAQGALPPGVPEGTLVIDVPATPVVAESVARQ